MSTTNLQILQDACLSANLKMPSALDSLSARSDQLLKMIDEAHQAVCGINDGYFLQRMTQFSTWGYASGSTAQVTGSGPYTVANLSASALHSTLTSNGKMTIEDFSSKGKDRDVVRINYASGTSGTILSPWDRGAHAGTDLDWVYGQDEYDLASDVEHVSWMLCHRNGTSERPIFLEPVSLETIERIRSNRSTYISNAQPNFYCVFKHGAGPTYTRRVMFDPFPYRCTITYGYMKKPNTLYSSSAVYLDVPDKWVQGVLDCALEKYFSTYGMGAEGGNAGQDNPQRLVEVRQSWAEIQQEIQNEARVAAEQFRVDPETSTRIFYREGLGRNF